MLGKRAGPGSVCGRADTCDTQLGVDNFIINIIIFIIIRGLGFEVWGLGFGVWGLGFVMQGASP